jgi:hypothetical protein
MLRPASTLNVNDTINLTLPFFAETTLGPVTSRGVGDFDYLREHTPSRSFALNVTSPVAPDHLVVIRVLTQSIVFSSATAVSTSVEETGIMSKSSASLLPSSVLPFSIPVVLMRRGVSAGLTVQHSKPGDSITIKLSPYMPLNAGETFEIDLPTFTGAGSECLLHLSEHQGIFEKAEWFAGRLTLTVGSEGMEIGAEGVVSFPSVAGLNLPEAGVPENWENLTIRTDACPPHNFNVTLRERFRCSKANLAARWSLRR